MTTLRLLVLLLGLPALAAAQATTTSLVLPSYGGSRGITWWNTTTAGEMRCFKFTARLGIPAATKMAAADEGAPDVGHTCGWGLYPDSDGGTALATISGACHLAGIISATGLTPFAVVQGTVYRLCWCSNNTHTSGSWGVYDAVSDAGTAAAMGKAASLNALSTNAAIAANTCNASTAAPPATTGALGTLVNSDPPLIQVEQ